MIWQNPWRLAAALLLAGGLGTAVLIAEAAPDAPAPVAAPPERTEPGVRPPTTTGAAAPAPPSTTLPTSMPALRNDELVDAVAQALTAWGRFASGDDLAVLDGSFHPDGPQYSRFVAEERTAERSEPIALRLGAVAATDTRTESSTVDTAVWIRSPDRTYAVHWRFHLVDAGGSWLVWTIEAQPQRPDVPHTLH